MKQKRIAAIHDISCFGRCSLTVALPLISAAGIETAVIPTAVLSTHTGGFSEYTFRDLTEDIMPVVEHWEKSDISVDAVYTGYLGSKKQVEIVKRAIEVIKRENSLVVVDPVMADNGRLYGGFPEDFPMEMRKLCAAADIITPNITEACFMLGAQYREGPYTKEYIEELLSGLSEITCGRIVLTGVWFDERRIGAAAYENGEISYVFSDRIERCYHGTGDVFSSTLVAAIVKGEKLKKATQIAVKFTYDCIKHTYENAPEVDYSVNFEAMIPTLLEYMDLI